VGKCGFAAESVFCDASTMICRRKKVLAARRQQLARPASVGQVHAG
jgi:hypothetical protein